MELSTHFLKSIVQLSNTASKDEIRYGLCGVWWNGKRLTVSNGYAGAGIDVEESTDKPFFFHTDDIKKIKTLLVINKRVQCQYTLEGKQLSGLGESIFLSTDQNTPFIEIDKVMDVKHETPFTFSFNAEYLLALAKATGDCKKAIRVTIDTSNAMKPIIVANHEGIGVLMPCKLS